MALELAFGLTAKYCVRTADVRAVICTFMFCDMFITFRCRSETLVEPFAIKARAFEHRRAVEEFDIRPRRGFHCKGFNGKSHFSQSIVQLRSFEACRILEF
jgi:hypothetical protein